MSHLRCRSGYDHRCIPLVVAFLSCPKDRKGHLSFIVWLHNDCGLTSRCISIEQASKNPLVANFTGLEITSRH